MAGAHEDRVRTPPGPPRCTHRRVDPEGPRSVVRRRDDASAVWIAPDHEGSLAELGVLELLDRGEERVQVEVSENRHPGTWRSGERHRGKARRTPRKNCPPET